MSLYGALLTGVSGLDANSRALSIMSSNIANVNTVGYKTSTADFSTFLASTGSAKTISPSSVHVTSNQQLKTQGLLTATASATDLAVSGQGFFIVTDNPANPSQMRYTRAGAFSPDADGLLRNSSGFYLEGWTLQPDGSMPANRSSLAPIDLSTLNGTAEATSTIALSRANLKSSATAVGAYAPGDMLSGAVTPEFQQTINIYDSQGTARPLQLAFVKTAADIWAYEIIYQGPGADVGGTNPVDSGTITFNPDGTLSVPATSSFTIPWDPAVTGLNSQDLTVTFGTPGLSNGVTQFDANSSLTSATINGAPFGSLASISVDDEGFVTALFDNGVQKKVFKVALATFPNANALAPLAGNVYQVTDESGAPTILEPKTGGSGAISSYALESSTVDLAKEFSNLIITQRAYSAATRIITTADQMLQELMQIKS